MLLNSNATFNAMEKLDSYGVLASKASTVCLNMNPLHGPKGSKENTQTICHQLFLQVLNCFDFAFFSNPRYVF